MRLAAQMRGGYYPASTEAVAHAAAFLRPPLAQPFSCLDPCAGEGMRSDNSVSYSAARRPSLMPSNWMTAGLSNCGRIFPMLRSWPLPASLAVVPAIVASRLFGLTPRSITPMADTEWKTSFC